MEYVTIKPCPMCDIRINTPSLVRGDGTYSVVCDCGAEGPEARTTVAAVERWNSRPIEDRLEAELAKAVLRADNAETLLRERLKELAP